MPEEDDFAAGFAQQPESKPQEEAKADPAPAPPPQEEVAAQDAKPEDKARDELEELRQQARDALHRERSSANRVSAFMRENDALKKRLEALEKAQAAAAAAPAASSDDDLDDVLKGAPDLKAAVEARVKRATEPLMRKLDEVTGRLGEVDERAKQAAADVQPLRERSQQADAQQVAQALSQEFPGWDAEVKKASFQNWLADQSREIRALYENGVTVREAGAVLKLYRADTGALAKPAETKEPAPKTTDATARLRQATGIPSRPAATKVDNADDFSAGFRMATS